MVRALVIWMLDTICPFHDVPSEAEPTVLL